MFSSARLWLIAILILHPFVAWPSLSGDTRSITAHMNAGRWADADRELVTYLTEFPEKAWAYSSHVWVLQNLKDFARARARADDGLRKWPDDSKIKAAYARVLVAEATNLAPQDAHALIEKAVQLDARDSTEFALAKSYRTLGHTEKAAELMEAGTRKYPKYEPFQTALEYTRYVHFTNVISGGKPDQIKKSVEQALHWLNPAKALGEQFYYNRMLHVGLRALNDQAYFESTYQSLMKRFTEDAQVYDDYGFYLYANYRIHHQATPELKAKAISYRRKAFALFWKKNQKPATIKNLGFPLKGRYAIWSEFGGTAMTHNGLSAYCYDFAATDGENNIRKPGGPGKENSEYFMFGQPVFAVAAGKVSGVISGFPDNAPGDFAGEANTITIDHGAYYSFYAHMKADGVLVKEGQSVKAGDLIGYAGNSGMSSESHLHFCINGKLSADVTVPFEFRPTGIIEKSGIKIKSSRPYREDDIVIFQ